MQSKFIERTVEVWSLRYGRTITNEEAIRIIEQFSTLFRILQEEADRLDGAMPDGKLEVAS